jgi:hypothetical protein
VTLGELFPDLKVPRPAASHVYWGYYQGLDREGRCLVRTVDGRNLAFDVRTGQAAPASQR